MAFSGMHSHGKRLSLEFKNFIYFRNNPHKKVSQDLTEKKQDLTEMSIILMVLIKI